MKQFEIPILFLIFNRLDETAIVFEEIKKIQPLKLYIAADGPRLDKENEIYLCEETKKVIDKINWPCQVYTLFRKENLGCKLAVSSAIKWFFENEEMGIILEDDCVPNKSFFSFCKEMLNFYKNDNRIMHIGGTNLVCQNIEINTSYYFSKMIHVWGWATWRRAWELYDIQMNDLYKFEKDKIDNIFNVKKHGKHWIKRFKNVQNGLVDTWDYQWVYSVWNNNGLSVIPNKNLIKNIGFNSNATHTKEEGFFSNMIQSELTLPYIFPTNKIQNYILDNYSNSIEIKPLKLKDILRIIINKVKAFSFVKH